MVYRRFQRPIVQSDKHEVTWSNLGEDASTIKNVQLIDVVQPSAKNAGNEVAVGSQVKGIYIEFNVSAENVGVTRVLHWMVAYKRDGQTSSNPNVYYQIDRSQILKRGMEMIPKDVSTVIKRIIFVPLPKAIHRQKENVQVNFLYISSANATQNLCGFAIYKEKS